LVGPPAERGNARAHVFATLGVVAGGGQHRVGVVLQTPAIEVVERCNTRREAVWLFADIRQRDEAVVAVEGRIRAPWP
jgi:hypothetical protein